MNTHQVLDAMKSGALLCVEHDAEGDMVFWLEPARPIVRKNIALKTIGAGSSKSEHDSLFEGTLPQTWRAV